MALEHRLAPKTKERAARTESLNAIIVLLSKLTKYENEHLCAVAWNKNGYPQQGTKTKDQITWISDSERLHICSDQLAGINQGCAPALKRHVWTCCLISHNTVSLLGRAKDSMY